MIQGIKLACGEEKEKIRSWSILISDKLDFKLKTVVRDTEGHYIILKGTIHQEDLTLWGTWVAQLVKWLPSAQVMIPASWDRVPH